MRTCLRNCITTPSCVLLTRFTHHLHPSLPPVPQFVYMCLLAIALVLRHLHTAKLAHCDFKPGNVLLRSSPWDARDFVCKLGDFR